MNLNNDEVTTHTGGLTTQRPVAYSSYDALRTVKTAPAPGVNTKSGHMHQNEFYMMTNGSTRPAPQRIKTSHDPPRSYPSQFRTEL